MIRRGGLAGLLLLAGCVAPAVEPPLPPATPHSPPPPVTLAGAASAKLDGAPIQGALIRGTVRPGTTLTLDGKPVAIAPDGAFVIGFDRDAPPAATLEERFVDGTVTTVATTRLTVASHDWRIERVDAPYRAGKTDAEFAAVRPAELARIVAARAKVTDAQGWRQRFIWPARGRQSGWFGSQRIYQGQPGSYHSGADVAVPAGTPVVAPADGVVILAAAAPFTLEGNLLMIDHGHGVSTALLHLSRIDVAVGQHVRQGEVVGLSGATGRVTGPHLHWGMQWSGAKLDPLLVVRFGPQR